MYNLLSVHYVPANLADLFVMQKINIKIYNND